MLQSIILSWGLENFLVCDYVIEEIKTIDSLDKAMIELYTAGSRKELLWLMACYLMDSKNPVTLPTLQ